MIHENKPSLDELCHYGVKRRSGRYPWGSGKEPFQRSGDFLSRVEELKKQGMSESKIAKTMGLTTTQLRTQKTLAKDERRSLYVVRAKDLRAKGHSLDAIAKKMGFNNDSSVRSLLNKDSEARMNQAKTTANFLKKMVDEKGMIDVGKGVERELGISKEKLKEALYILEREGYNTYGGGVPQVTNKGRQTNLKVLCPPGTEHKEIYNFDKINSVKDYNQMLTEDGTKIRPSFVYPSSMDSKRLKIRYAEEGGAHQDGLIQIRRGVKDLSLGESNYAQVRILVDHKKYIKGMAVYSDDLPKGKDVIFNTNKKSGTPMEDVLKDIKKDADNPFGSLIKERGGQSYYDDPKGIYTDPVTKKKQSLSLINKRAEEGDWGKWADNLPAQFLSKQRPELITRQLKIAKEDKRLEYNEIKSLTNPTIKKHLLQSFADDCDAAAAHLKAAALPRQKYQVLLPVKSMKDHEVYAPNYRNGEKVSLVRYPHGGTFEIPTLTVNNKNKEAQKMMGKNPLDAIGINHKVAERLSGADFDGDTSMVIPTNRKTKITSTPPLKALEGFDPKMSYPERKGMRYMKHPKTGVDNTQYEMGNISNLISDMTLKGANEREIAKAVKHSMVVIDAAKHKLDYKKSEIDNDIATLKRKWQGRYDENGRYREGASTLISRAKSQQSVPKRKGSPIIDPLTGEQTWKTDPDRFYTNKKGKVVERMQKSRAMYETRDAYSLVSKTRNPKELLYADYANSMKALANEARKEMLQTGKIPYSRAATKAYQKEVASLNSKLNISEKNAPRERRAQTMANAIVKAKIQADPSLSKSDIKKISQQALTSSRIKVGAKRNQIELTDREWDAIQSGAISESKLKQIIKYVDIDKIRERATPRKTKEVSKAMISRIQNYSKLDYTTAQIAAALGISPSTVNKYLKGE